MITGEFEILPKGSNFEVSFAMHSECSNRCIPKQGVDVLFIYDHMHYLEESITMDRNRYPN